MGGCNEVPERGEEVVSLGSLFDKVDLFAPENGEEIAPLDLFSLHGGQRGVAKQPFEWVSPSNILSKEQLQKKKRVIKLLSYRGILCRKKKKKKRDQGEALKEGRRFKFLFSL